MEKGRLETRLTSGQSRERDTLTTVGSVNSDIEVSVIWLQFLWSHLFFAKLLQTYDDFKSFISKKDAYKA